MSSSKLKQTFVKPLVVGIISALGSKVMGANYNVGIPLLGDVPAAVFYGLLGTGSSLASETLHQWVLPYLPQSAEMVKMENAVLSPALHGGLNVAVLYFAYPGILKEFGYLNPLLLGAGAEVLGSYSFDNFVAVMSWMS